MLKASEIIADVVPDLSFDLQEGDVVTDVIMIVRTNRMDSVQDALYMDHGKGTGGVVAAGMLHGAQILHDNWMRDGYHDEDDDD